MRFESLVVGRTAASIALALAVGTGCSLVNAPDDVKAGAGGAGGSNSTVTGVGGATSTSTTTTTSTTTSTTGATTGGGGGAGGSGTCPGGTADCDGDPETACDPLDTAEHCGDCNTTCSAATMNVATPACTAGACDYDACAAGFADCDGDRTNGCEASTSTDASNCGACMNACSPQNVDTAACNDGKCGYGACQQGFGDCNGSPADGCETPLTQDLANCGACSNVCTPQHVDSAMCSGGKCGYGACQLNFADCNGNPADGCETDLGGDLGNCGGCGIACGVGAQCKKGLCVAPAPFFDSLTGAISSTSRGAGDSCGTLVAVSANVSIGQIAVRNSLGSAGNLKFLVFDHATKQLIYVSSPKFFGTGDSWKASNGLALVLLAGHSYDIGAISDVAGTWSFDLTAESVGPLSSQVQNPNFSNYAAPSEVGNSGADCGIRLYP